MTAVLARIGTIYTASAVWCALPARHLPLVMALAAVSLAHIAEHVVQLAQIYVLGWPRPTALGLLGLVWPALVQSEWLHYAYASVMLAGLLLLARGFHGRARYYWNIAVAIQLWHWFEHLCLWAQALFTGPWFGESVPTSWLQEALNLTIGRGFRPELHMTYTLIVLGPMAYAMALYMRQSNVRRALHRFGQAYPSYHHTRRVVFFNPPEPPATLEDAVALAKTGPNGDAVNDALAHGYRVEWADIGATLIGNALAFSDHLRGVIGIPNRSRGRSVEFLATLIAHEADHTQHLLCDGAACEVSALKAGGRFWEWVNHGHLPVVSDADVELTTLNRAADFATGRSRCYTLRCDAGLAPW